MTSRKAFALLPYKFVNFILCQETKASSHFFECHKAVFFNFSEALGASTFNTGTLTRMSSSSLAKNSHRSLYISGLGMLQGVRYIMSALAPSVNILNYLQIDVALFQQSGDNLLWILTKLVTYIVHLWSSLIMLSFCWMMSFICVLSQPNFSRIEQLLFLAFTALICLYFHGET